MDLMNFKYNVVPGKTIVVCPEKVLDMEQGWEEEMDSMVGVPLLVEEKTKSAVYLAHDSGDTYAFGYHHIELAKEIVKIPVELGHYKFKILEHVNSSRLRERMLAEDFIRLSKVPGLNFKSTYVQINSEALEKIQQTCPRVIGVLLSYNFMERVN